MGALHAGGHACSGHHLLPRASGIVGLRIPPRFLRVPGSVGHSGSTLFTRYSHVCRAIPACSRLMSHGSHGLILATRSSPGVSHSTSHERGRSMIPWPLGSVLVPCTDNRFKTSFSRSMRERYSIHQVYYRRRAGALGPDTGDVDLTRWAGVERRSLQSACNLIFSSCHGLNPSLPADADWSHVLLSIVPASS
jgi:hypothetical protein